MAAEGVEELPAPAVAVESAEGSATILLVEDDPAVRAFARRVLEKRGYRVIEAADPAEAIVLAQGDAGFDLLVTDVVLPAMSGGELAQRLSGHRPGMRVLYVSGFTQDLMVHRGILDERIHFLQKPFVADELAAKVREALTSAAPRPCRRGRPPGPPGAGSPDPTTT